MTQENPRYLSVVRNGQIQCARGTCGLREIVDPVRPWVAARKKTLMMVQPCCSMQWLPHGVACVGENIIGTSCWSHPCWGHTAVGVPRSPAGQEGACTHPHSEPGLHLWVQGREAALLPCSHTTPSLGCFRAKRSSSSSQCCWFSQPGSTKKLTMCHEV